MLSASAVGGLVVSLLGPGLVPVLAPEVPAIPTGPVRIEVVTVNGSGCRPGTAAVAVAPDKTVFTVTYSDYVVVVGAGGHQNSAKKKCKIDLAVSVPAGYTYAVSQADYRGYGYLHAGVHAVQRAKYHFQGQSNKVYVEHPFAGPFDDSWQSTDRTEPAALEYATCGKVRPFNIDTELTLTAATLTPDATNSFGMDTADVGVAGTYRFAWKRCPAAR